MIFRLTTCRVTCVDLLNGKPRNQVYESPVICKNVKEIQTWMITWSSKVASNKIQFPPVETTHLALPGLD